MAKKKINDLSDLGGFVFSTNKEADFSDFSDENEETLKPQDQHLEGAAHRTGQRREDAPDRDDDR